MRHTLFALPLLLLGITAASTSRADEYHLGQGLLIGDFLLSGYANLVAEAPQGGIAKASIDDFSLFVSGRVNRWVNPFLETEISSLTLAQQGDGPRANGHFILERFYNDTSLSESDTLRVGKMLAPVGDWNLVHAAPLVPTVTRPLTTFLGFSEYTNGLSWLHETPSGEGPNSQLYWQPSNEWHERPSSITHRHYRDVWGAHISWPHGFTDKIGASFQHGQLLETGETYNVYGINVRRSFGKLLMESEATTSNWSGTAPRMHDHETGIYMLADYAATPRWHGILEWEHFQSHLVDQASRNTLLGVAYKPESTLVWKLEYVHQMDVSADIQSGWFASLSTLF
ncbi:MAG: hypothetical protein P4L77_02375 [Sulfuriferula sp.]|nr:hypothetical protein [Sulfuriferula sp.]